jgi:heme A synthase
MSGGETGRVSPGRAVLGSAGVLLAAYGAWLLLSRQDLERNLDVALWLAGGVLVHDVLLGSVVIVVSLLATRLLPAVARPAAGAGLVVLGSLTVLAVPFLGGFGRENAPDNPTLLDRDYTAGYLALAATVIIVVVLPVLLHSLRARRDQR